MAFSEVVWFMVNELKKPPAGIENKGGDVGFAEVMWFVVNVLMKPPAGFTIRNEGMYMVERMQFCPMLYGTRGREAREDGNGGYLI